MYPLEEQVLWLAEDSAGIKQHIQSEHTYVYFNFTYQVHNQTIQYQVQFTWSCVASYKGLLNANPQRNEMGQSSQHNLRQAYKYIVRLTKPDGRNIALNYQLTLLVCSIVQIRISLQPELGLPNNFHDTNSYNTHITCNNYSSQTYQIMLKASVTRPHSINKG